MNNPLLKPSSLPFFAPDFASLKTEHFLPAFDAGMKEQMAEVEAIAQQKAPATFENTLVALEKTGATLLRTQRVFSHLTGVDTTEELQKIEAEVAPKLAAHSDNILLNAALFARVKSLYDQRTTLGLNEESGRLLTEQYEAFVRAGAMLNAEQQVRIRAINEELSSATTKFQENLLALTKERSVIVDSKEELQGLSDAEIAAAAEAAEKRGFAGKYLLPITNTTRQPVLASLANRETRRRVWEASANRGKGLNGGIDNRPLVQQIAKLRAEKAKLLGYENHATYVLENQMAKTPKAAMEMLDGLVPAVVEKAKQEAAEIEAVMKQEGLDGTVQPWDWEYYAEKVRKAKYDVDDNVVREYFELDQVLEQGVFKTMNRLFGIEFRERKDLPLYRDDVRVFDVIDKDGKQIGLFYGDYYQRDSKRGGAWMDNLVGQSKLLGEKPVVVNVMSIPKPVPGEPALVSFDHATTMFHEMGHAVHGLFSDVEYPTLSGTNVPRDFVEFPSTFQEDWAIDPDVLKNFGKHYKTGEPIPAELLKKVIAARQFNQGFDTLEYLSSALLDLEWHSLSPDEIPTDVEAFELAALAKHGIRLSAIPPRYKTPFFAHIWSGGYSAGYYAYLWSEVLAADSFAYVGERGGLSLDSGEAFRKGVLSRGGTREPMMLYREFRGKDPDVKALLIRRGLLKQ